MSGFLNLSDTLAAARSRAARSGDTLRSLLTQSPVSATSAGSDRGDSFATLGRQMAGRGPSPAWEREGVSGELSSLRSGGGTRFVCFCLIAGGNDAYVLRRCKWWGEVLSTAE
jgi:hypothetical protein